MSEVAGDVSADKILGFMGLADKKPAPKADAPVPAQADTVDAPEPVAVSDAPTPDSQPEPVNTYKFNFKGADYEVVPELKELHDGYLRQEDYTRKASEVAERARVIELAEQQSRSQRELQQVAAPYLEQIMQINNQISHYAKVDWAAYSDQDPQQANKHWMAYQSLKERKGALESEMNGVAAQHLNRLKETAAKLKDENSKILSQKVKGWGVEREQKVRDFVKSQYGYTDTEIGQVFDARLLRLMNDAMDLHALREAKPVKQALPASKTLKPGAVESKPKEFVVRAEMKKDIRNAKSESAKARGIQKMLERML